MPNVDSHEAHKRAVADYLEFSQFARTAAQFTFGANGGAAAAVLSFITTTANSGQLTIFDRRLIVRNFSIGCSFYVAGLLVAAISMYFFARSKKRWGDAWEDASCSPAATTSRVPRRRRLKVRRHRLITLIVSGRNVRSRLVFCYPGFLANNSTGRMTGGILLLDALRFFRHCPIDARVDPRSQVADT